MLNAVTAVTEDPDSFAAGRALAEALHAGAPPVGAGAVLLYATMLHDQAHLLAGMRAALDPAWLLVGCSTQGVMARGLVSEEGYVAGAMALSGEGVHVGAASAAEVGVDPAGKGRALGRALREQCPDAKVLLVFWDPLSGVDTTPLFAGIHAELPVPLVGGAASQPWGVPVKTCQYLGDAVVTRAAVALALGGAFDLEVARCTGAVPTGLSLRITRADGNRILEIDGRRALDVWAEMVGSAAVESDNMTSWAIGLREATLDGAEDWTIQSAFAFDHEQGAVVVQASVESGRDAMFFHRTPEASLDGTRRMGEQLRARLAGRSLRAVLGFECGARTGPFLGPEATQRENEELQAMVAPDAPWLGMLAWGEATPVPGGAAFCNFTFPLLVLTGEAPSRA
jgi:hypothetical protein